MSTRTRWLLIWMVVLASLAVGAACGGGGEKTPTPGGATATPTALSGKLEIFSWWTTGGEAAGLQALYNLYPTMCGGNVNIVNSTVAGGGGANARQVLTTRMLGNDPPGSFQVHMGHELIDSWVTTGYMQPLDDLYKSQGWNDVFPRPSWTSSPTTARPTPYP